MRRWGPALAICILTTLTITASLLGPDLYAQSDSTEGVYHDSLEISAMLMDLAETEPDIAEYTTAQDLLGVRSIPGGRSIPLLILGNEEENRPWVMLVGAHHGDEPDSAEAILGFAQYMIYAQMAGDVHAAHILDSVNIAVLPVVNPYGLDISSRYDENGEDPNRDYPFAPAGTGPHSDGIPLTTAGAMTVHKLAQRYPFSVALSFHTGSQGIFTPWGAPDVGNVSPDGYCFMDMARVLQQASGRPLPYGPANDFSYVGYLNGAMEDHLYGSKMLSDRLYSSEMALPWSSFTATVELSNGKGKDSDRLGSLSGVMDPGGPEDGTLAIGIRTSLAACTMSAPFLKGDVTYGEEMAQLDLTLSGTVNPSVIDPSPAPFRTSSILDGLLPMAYYYFEWERPAHGTYLVNITAVPDPSWPLRHPSADPPISPVSQLSLSRGLAGYPRELSFCFVIEGEAGPEPIMPTLTLVEVQPDIPEVGSIAQVWLSIDLKDTLATGLKVNASCGGTWTLTEFEAAEIKEGYAEYSFQLPMASGATVLEIELSTDLGTVKSVGAVLTEPSIYIQTLVADPDHPELARMLVGIEGTFGPVTVVYGVLRNGPEVYPYRWLVGPLYHVCTTVGTSYIDVNVSGLGGEITFVVGTLSGRVTDSRERFIPRDPKPIGTTINVLDDALVLGPALLVQRANGLAPVEPDGDMVVFEVEVTMDGEIYYQGELPFVRRENIGQEISMVLDELIKGSGLDPRYVSGCYLAYLPAPNEEARMEAEFHAEGRVQTPTDLPQVNFYTSYVSSGPLIVDRVGSEDEDRSFPWSIIVLIVMAAIFVLVITVIRYEAHWKEPQPNDVDLDPRTSIRPKGNRSDFGTRNTSGPKGPALTRLRAIKDGKRSERQ